MRTAYIASLMVMDKAVAKKALEASAGYGGHLVIGVKNKASSLENLMERFPNLHVVKLKEVVNGNYLGNAEDHTLQPAFITWKDEPSPPPAPVSCKAGEDAATARLRAAGLKTIGGKPF